MVVMTTFDNISGSFHTGYLLGRRKCLLSPKIFTNLHIIMYILILDFQLVVGGGEKCLPTIGQIMQGSLSLTRGVVGGKKLLLY